MKKKAPVVTVIAFLSILFIIEIATLSKGIFKSVFPNYISRAPEEDFQLIEIEPDPYQEPYNYDLSPQYLERNINVTYGNIFTFIDFDIIKKSLYNIDSTAYVYDSDIDFNRLLGYNMETNLQEGPPKILIFHTHSRESFIDSRDGFEEDTIVGVGDRLAEILEQNYGIPVIHHKGVYDMKDGKEVRDGSYERMEPDIQEVLRQNPSLEVLIDLHRDALPDDRRLITDINGAPTARIMFFNGICRENKNGEPKDTQWLENEYLDENMALSLRMKLLANEMFPGFTRKNYIKPYRYSLHMKPKSMLIEVGSNMNTVEEAKNAMVPLAEILVRALS